MLTLGGVVGKSSLKMIWPYKCIQIRIAIRNQGKRGNCLVESPLPGCSLLPRDAILPEHQVHGTICILHWPGIFMIIVEICVQGWQSPSDETKGVILPPAFSLLRQPGLGDPRHLSEIGLALRNMKLENECFKMHRFERMFDGLPLCIIEASGVTKWSPKWDFHPPYLGLWGSITSTRGDLREPGF